MYLSFSANWCSVYLNWLFRLRISSLAERASMVSRSNISNETNPILWTGECDCQLVNMQCLPSPIISISCLLLHVLHPTLLLLISLLDCAGFAPYSSTLLCTLSFLMVVLLWNDWTLTSNFLNGIRSIPILTRNSYKGHYILAQDLFKI